MITVVAPAKINLFLRICGKIDGGYHLLDSAIVFTRFGDNLTIELADNDQLAITGEFASELDSADDNLVMIALRGFRAAGGVIRGLSVGVVVIIAAQFFVTFTVHNLFLMMIVIILSSTLFSMCGFLNGLFASDWDDINVIPTFIMTPLTYLGGIFFSISMLPGIWQDIALINPILYLINALRFSMLGITDVSVAIAFLIILLFNIVLAALCIYFLKIGKGLRT